MARKPKVPMPSVREQRIERLRKASADAMVKPSPVNLYAYAVAVWVATQQGEGLCWDEVNNILNETSLKLERDEYTPHTPGGGHNS